MYKDRLNLRAVQLTIKEYIAVALQVDHGITNNFQTVYVYQVYKIYQIIG